MRLPTSSGSSPRQGQQQNCQVPCQFPSTPRHTTLHLAPHVNPSVLQRTFHSGSNSIDKAALRPTMTSRDSSHLSPTTTPSATNRSSVGMVQYRASIVHSLFHGINVCLGVFRLNHAVSTCVSRTKKCTYVLRLCEQHNGIVPKLLSAVFVRQDDSQPLRF
jgi:hypothetical protein